MTWAGAAIATRKRDAQLSPTMISGVYHDAPSIYPHAGIAAQPANGFPSRTDRVAPTGVAELADRDWPLGVFIFGQGGD